jgi:hypothetical protein
MTSVRHDAARCMIDELETINYSCALVLRVEDLCRQLINAGDTRSPETLATAIRR